MSTERGIGQGLLDVQHGAIDDSLRELDARAAAGDAAGAGRVLERLWDEVVSHFATEEQLMELHAYPERNAHRSAHQLFLEDLRQLAAELAARGCVEEVVSWARQRLPQWVTFHVETNDHPLVRFLARKASGGRAPGPLPAVPARPKSSDA